MCKRREGDHGGDKRSVRGGEGGRHQGKGKRFALINPKEASVGN